MAGPRQRCWQLLLALAALTTLSAQARALTAARPEADKPAHRRWLSAADPNSNSIGPRTLQRPSNRTAARAPGKSPQLMSIIHDAATLQRLPRRTRINRAQPAKVSMLQLSAGLLSPGAVANITTGRLGSMRSNRRAARMRHRSRGQQRTANMTDVRPPRQQRGLLQATTNQRFDYLLDGECIRATANGDGWLTSSDGLNSLVITSSGRAVMYFTAQMGGLTEPRWTTVEPQAVSLPVRLCLNSTGRVSVIDASNAELAVLYAGASAPYNGRIAAYVQDDGRFVVYDPNCAALAVTPSSTPMLTNPPCLTAAHDILLPGTGAAAPGAADKSFNFQCPSKGHVIKIGGFTRAGELSALGPIECSSGVSSEIWGLQASTAWTHASAAGYRVLTVGSDEAGVTKLQFDSATSVGFADSQPQQQKCPPGMLVAGVSGTYSDSGNSSILFTLAWTCRSACYDPAPTLNPGVLSCTNDVSKIHAVGQTCQASALCADSPDQVAVASCTAMGSWVIQDPCPQMLDSDTRQPVDIVEWIPRRYNFSCPPGAYVSGFSGSAGDWLYAFGVTCSDGSQSELWGSLTMPGEASWRHSSPEGYSNISMLIDDASINELRLAADAAFGSSKHGGRVTEYACEPGTVLAGVHGITSPAGKQGAFIHSLGLICRKVCGPAADFTCPVSGPGATAVVGRYCSGECAAGSLGTVKATCSSAGIWRMQNSSCTLGCRTEALGSTPADSLGWDWACESTNNPYAAVGYRCQALCAVEGAEPVERVCQAGGSWSPAQGSCPVSDLAITAPGDRTWVVQLGNLRSFPEARASCRQRGGDLLTITSAEDNRVLLEALQQYYTNVWIGLKLPVGAGFDNGWRWVLGDRPVSYTNWRAGEPFQYPDASELCADFSNDGSWGAYYCDTPQAFACQFGCSADRLPQAPANSAWPIEQCQDALIGSVCTAECTDGYVPGIAGPPRVNCTERSWDNRTVTGSCTIAELQLTAPSGKQLLVRPLARMTQAAARSFCQQKQGDLVSILSDADNQFIASSMSQAGYNQSSWTGLVLPAGATSQGSWIWSSTTQPASYLDWATGQPGDLSSTGVERCSVLIPNAPAAGRWRRASCNETLGLICQIGCSGGMLPPATISVSYPMERCDGAAVGARCMASCGEDFLPDAAFGAPTITCTNQSWSLGTVNGSCVAPELRLTAPSNRSLLLLPLTRVTQPQARTFCQQQGGDLITVASDADNQFIHTSMLQSGFNRSLWTGLVTPGGVPNTSPSSWRWSSNNQTAEYANWAASEPQDYAPLQPQCSILSTRAGGRWQSTPCNQTAGVVCQIGCSVGQLPPAPFNSSWPAQRCDGAGPGSICEATCGSDFVPDSVAGAPRVTCTGQTWNASSVPGACISPELRLTAPSGRNLLLLPLTRVTQPEARAFCQRQGGDLVTVASAVDNQFIVNKTLQSGFNRSLWMGLVTLGGVANTSPNSWLWSSNNQTAEYINWAASEPQDYAPLQPQCSILATGTAGTWRSALCTKVAGVVCQLGCSATQLPVAPAGATWPTRGCDGAGPGAVCTAFCGDEFIPDPERGSPNVICNGQSWNASGVTGACIVPELRLAAPSGKQLLVRPLARLTQSEARIFCQRQQGELAAITSAADNQFILDNTQRYNRSLWIGLATPGGVPNTNLSSWLWSSSNQAAVYTNWAAGEPRDSAPLRALCSTILPGSGRWRSLNCSQTFGVVCGLGCLGTQLPLPPSNSSWPVTDCDGATAGAICTGACADGTIADRILGAPRVSCTNSSWAPNTVAGACMVPELNFIAPSGKRILLRPVTRLTQADARAFCQQRNGDLVTVATAADATNISNQMLLNGFNQSLWIGLSANAESNTWQWSSSNQAANYTAWTAGAQGQGGCSVTMPAAAGAWQAVSCNERFGFACQIGCSGTQLPATPANSDGWPVDQCDGAGPGAVCTAACANAYIPSTTLGAPQVTCGDPTWNLTSLAGSCVLECEPGRSSIIGPASNTTCAAFTFATPYGELNYTVSSNRGLNVETVTVEAVNAPGVACQFFNGSQVVTPTNLPSGTNVTVRCTRPTQAPSQFPERFQVMIRVTSGRGRCADSANFTTVVSTVCCAPGMTYARNPANSTCLNLLSGTPACKAEGFVNVFTASNTTYPLVWGDTVNSQAGCANTAPAGSLTVSCTGGTTASFRFQAISQTLNQASANGTATRYFYVGCQDPVSNPGKTDRCDYIYYYGTSSNPCRDTWPQGASVDKCGGIWSVTQPRLIVLNCPCSRVRFILASLPPSGSSFVSQRPANGVCIQ